MTNRRLYNDDARCLGARCDVKHECLRYLQRHQCGERTPIYNNACYNVGDAFIKRGKDKFAFLNVVPDCRIVCARCEAAAKRTDRSGTARDDKTRAMLHAQLDRITE